MFYVSISFEITHFTRMTLYLINMKTRLNLLLIKMKKQVSEFTWVIPLLKKIFGKHFKLFYKFEDPFDEFIKFFCL